MICLECEKSKVVLQGPDFGDIHTVNMNVTFKKTMSGRVRTYIKKPTHIKTFTISKVNGPKRNEILNFLLDTYGKEIKVSEYFDPPPPAPEKREPSSIWKGKVTSSIETIHQAVRDNRTSLTFEGINYG